MEIKVRLVPVSSGPVVTAKVIRVTPTQVHFRDSAGFQHVCNKALGRPYGSKGIYSIHPEDLHLVQDEAATKFVRTDKRNSSGTPTHWDV